MNDQLTLAELDDQAVELLPDRETLWTISVTATNSSMALNAATFNSWAGSVANQAIWIG